MGQGLRLQGASGEVQPQPASRIHGLYSRACPARGGSVKGAADSALLTQEETGSEGDAQSGRAQGQRGGHREPGYGLDHGTCRRRRRLLGHLRCGYPDRTRTLGLSLLRLVRVLPAELRPRAPSGGPTALLQSPAQASRAPSGGRAWNLTWPGTRPA